MSELEAVRVAVSLAEAGVTFEKKAARCPLCGRKMKTVSSGKKEAARVRRHRCGNPACLMAVMDQTVKSVEG